jgi:import inner membrane translocase subunit TIM54
LAGDRSLEAEQQRELEGGIVIIGRHTFKEYMEGLRRGWSESVYTVDREDQLARRLQNDGLFDEKDEETLDDHSGVAITPSLSATQPKTATEPKPIEPLAFPPAPNPALAPFTALRRQPGIPSVQPQQQRPAFVDEPPSVLPFHPPIGLVPYTNHLGFLQTPYMVYDFFTQRYRVQSGCEAAHQIVRAHARSIQTSDLEFDLNSEQHIKGSFSKVPRRIEKAREEYYKEVTKKLKIARELARREREPTKAEMTNAPPTEVELRAERMKKELKWTSDLEGWEILKKPLAWDERFRTAIRVFDDPPSSTGLEID